MSAEEPWVEVVPHDGRWAESYRAEAAAIRAALGDYVAGIEHFGSTAVPGLIAKPIVDILIGARTGSEPREAIDGLAGLGYEYLGEDGRRPGRLFWRRRGLTNFNVSVVPHLGALWNGNLVVRDFLRTHPEWVARYGQVKHDAAAATGTSMLGYQDRKRDFVDELRAAALAWAAKAIWASNPVTMDIRSNDYDSFAEAYSAENENNLVNAYYERPAMLTLAGDVAGRHILDAGCGSGPLTAALRDRGAVVTGIDSSSGMLTLARRRLGEDVSLQVVDLRDPLPFGEETFDDVVASLVLHYLENWGPTLAELRRVLKPGGRLIVSVEHPVIAYMIQDPLPNYLATNSYSFDWTFDGQAVLMTFWRRPLHAMTDAFTRAGFRLSLISEPQPDPAAKELFPDDFEALSTQPNFLFFVLEAVPPPVATQ